VAIAGGEGLERRSDFGRLLDDGIDIVQPDVGICGGIGEACFVAELAALHGRACVPHGWPAGVGRLREPDAHRPARRPGRSGVK
jgi:L-alanine-DL-glutamate epimerase-like enolase superfamily enzyme